MKILFILDHFYPHIGGAETLFFNLINDLRKKNNLNIKVLTSNSGGINGLNKISKNYHIEYKNWKIITGHPIPNLIDLYKNIKKFDIIHTATYSSAFFSFFISKLLNKKIIITVYENLGFDWFKIENFFKALIYFIFEWLTIHLPFDKYIAISKYTKNQLVKFGINERKIHVIYPFLEDNKFLIRKPENFDLFNIGNNINKYFLFYGRPGKTKGIFVLLRAINLIKDKINKDFKFLFILSNDPKKEKEKVIKFIEKNKLNDLIIVLESLPKEELNYLIKKSYCVIVPSITEGFGYSAYEAILMNKKIIISNAGSLSEIVSGNYLIFENQNYKDLGDKIIMAVKNKFLHKKKWIVNKKDQIKRLIKIYNSLIN